MTPSDRSGRDPHAQAWASTLDKLERMDRLHMPRVRNAMATLPRWRFMPPGATVEEQRAALRDAPVGIGHGQTISAPHMVAMLIEAAQAAPGDRCLEIGGGSGYLAAVLAHVIGPEGRVVTMEILPELAALARQNLADAGLADRVDVVVGDGSLGCPQQGPYDAIIVSCAAPDVPAPLPKQLADGGRLILPVGPRGHQRLTKLTRQGDELDRQELTSCAFVPLVGRHGFDHREG